MTLRIQVGSNLMLELLEPHVPNDSFRQVPTASRDELGASLRQDPSTQEHTLPASDLLIACATGKLATGQFMSDVPSGDLLVTASNKGHGSRRREPRRPHIVVSRPVRPSLATSSDGGTSGGNGGEGLGSDDHGDWDDDRYKPNPSRYPSTPMWQRKGSDMIIRPGEQFHRKHLDRSITTVSRFFSGLGYVGDFQGEAPMALENTPLFIGEMVTSLNGGKAAIASVGCGTGRELYTWGKYIADDLMVPLSNIQMTGVSRNDYSGESMSRQVVTACTGPRLRLRYLVAEAAHMPIPTHSQDVTLSFNLLMHNENASSEVLEEMIRITRPGDVVLGSTSVEQMETGNELPDFLESLTGRGWRISCNPVRTVHDLQRSHIREVLSESVVFGFQIPE